MTKGMSQPLGTMLESGQRLMGLTYNHCMIDVHITHDIHSVHIIL